MVAAGSESDSSGSMLGGVAGSSGMSRKQLKKVGKKARRLKRDAQMRQIVSATMQCNAMQCTAREGGTKGPGRQHYIR